MGRTWDLWVKGLMVLTICPAMHFGVVGLGDLGEPTSADLQYAWDVTFEPDYAVLISDVEPDDEMFPAVLADEDDEQGGI